MYLADTTEPRHDQAELEKCTCRVGGMYNLLVCSEIKIQLSGHETAPSYANSLVWLDSRDALTPASHDKAP
ncbi:unnamed protein product [Fusarium graminearum]|uniref:Chromosome 1, complete genome n=1 Tax=Gibberella zeae (strain ATCC MYA-4620 / CBS 123657 / FGSC 9075 / NRRL 31084 / PH-1) TaxID=229533 RepID=A0A0E0RQQ6_GIBZE|nr:hypothetical protein FG05_35283 [Fusarium graminearum]CEF73581.1 unnamed protein product [Fusarium graminearum]CZS76850.1 unnamed protein product [Fusarium graminearum]